MSLLKTLLISLVSGVVLLGVFSWPLYLHFDEGIPHTARRTESEPVRDMVQGDHLQLLYHFWLLADWVAGDTLFSHDLYQFNTGDDEARTFPTTDYLPYSGVFALAHPFMSRAAAWNLVTALSLGFSIFFLWRLIQIHKLATWPAFTLALAMTSLPYQWATSFGGSPTGFAMMAVPMLFLGIELGVRKGSLKGGLLASAALAFAFWTDTHTLLFSFLMGPLWAILVLLDDGAFPWRRREDWWSRVRALSPLLVMALLTLFLRLRTKQQFNENSVVSGGWSWNILQLFSPGREGLFTWQSTRHDYPVYLGIPLLLLLVAALICAVRAFLRGERRWNRMLHYLALWAIFAGMVAFGLGTNGPFDALALRAARTLLPPFTMMRQTAKIFAMLAPILALLALPLWRTVSESARRPGRGLIFSALLAAVILADWRLQVAPGVSLINRNQEAYAAVAADAEIPRAVVLPIWPGDSAWASLYQHNASLHRLRMINGYSPVVAQDYVESVFAPLMSTNAGVLTPSQIELLEGMGVGYILLHQDAFPEKVSWFPVGATLQHLLVHPRLELMEQDHNVWAFRIRETPRSELPPLRWTRFGSRFQADFSHEPPPPGAGIAEDPHAAFGRYMRLVEPDTGVTLRTVDQHQTPDPHLMIRVRGRANWQVRIHQCEAVETVPLEVDATDWTWISVPLRWREDCDTWQAEIRLMDGELELDTAHFMSGSPPRLEPGESLLIPAATFYHAGYTDLERGAVVLRPEADPAARIFYGPRWILPEGEYQAELVYAAPPPAGAEIGRFELKPGPSRTAVHVDLRGPVATPLSFSTRDVNLPLEFGLHYARQVEVALRGVRITRIR